MDAVFEKFDAIYDNDEGPKGKVMTASILEEICSDLWSTDWKGREDGRGFQRFRQMFNAKRPKNAERFLNRMERNYTPDNPKLETEHDVICRAMIQTLREDMKKWSSKGRKSETPADATK